MCAVVLAAKYIRKHNMDPIKPRIPVVSQAAKAADAAAKKQLYLQRQQEADRRRHEAERKRLQNKKQQTSKHAETVDKESDTYASKYKTEEVKKYKKAQKRELMGFNATFNNKKDSSKDAQMADNAYEATKYNIPFDRKGAEGKQIGHDETLSVVDTKKELNRRKAMKVVKTYVDEGIGDGVNVSVSTLGQGGLGGLTSDEPEKSYKLIKKKKTLKEMGFTEPSGASQEMAGNISTQDDLSNPKSFLTIRGKKKNKAVNEFTVPLGATGKRKKVFTTMVPIRMADGTIKRLPPGKSGSSGGGGY